MKVEVDVNKDSLILRVDSFSLDIYEDMALEAIEDPIKKSVWIASIGYEVERRLNKFRDVEKRGYMAHWREWALKWIRVKNLKDVMDVIDCTVIKLFVEDDINKKIGYACDIAGRFTKSLREFTVWGEFDKDLSISDVVKETCKEMYRMEFQRNMTPDKAADLEYRMESIVKSCKSIAEGYKSKGETKKFKI